tara:strand:+ start:7917 stop:9698 length:1782 start_codon:yes stop_codon:yes gene_type:complete
MPRKRREIDFKYNFYLYLGLLKKYKWRVFLILSLVFMIEASYLVGNFLFKLIIDRGNEFLNKTLNYETYLKILIIFAIIFLSSIVLRFFFKFMMIHFMNLLSMNLIIDLKRKFFNHIIHLSYEFHTTHKTGSLISRLGRGGAAVERMTDVLIFNFSPLLFQLVITGAALIYFDLISGVVAMVAAISFVTYSILIQNKQKIHNVYRNEKEDLEKAYISDIMTNIDSIKHFGKENYIKNRFKHISKITGLALLKFWKYFRWMDSGQGTILAFGSFFLVFFPMLKFLKGDLEIGTLVFIYTAYGNFIGPMYAFVSGTRDYYRSMGDFEDLFQYNKIENEIKDKSKAEELNIKKGEIEFKDITFNYGKRRIFENFNLKVNKNQKIALVGHSGSGKTTLIKLLYRLYNLNRGRILIDGKDIKELKQESLRSELSIVPQECVLFDDTIYNNIAFSDPSANRKEVLKAMKFAQLDKIIEEFPNKEKTIVGERGVRLSGGEKQRVSIARAILANKKILVLDEATSSLDSQTEHDIQEDLKKLMQGRTSLIIAHRLSTIMHADKIVVLEKGKIVQIGKHRDLIRSKGVYKRLWNLQKGGYIK